MAKPLKMYAYRLGGESARRLRVVAKLYGARPATFIREMIEAICAGDQARTIAFLGRVESGIRHQQQLEMFAEARAEARKPGKVALGVVQQGRGRHNAA